MEGKIKTHIGILSFRQRIKRLFRFLSRISSLIWMQPSQKKEFVQTKGLKKDFEDLYDLIEAGAQALPHDQKTRLPTLKYCEQG